jgi:hypothetical protein
MAMLQDFGRMVDAMSLSIAAAPISLPVSQTLATQVSQQEDIDHRDNGGDI